MPTTTTTLRPLHELENWEANYRIGDVLAIRRSVERFGFLGALRTRGNVVYAGNHVLKALKELEEAGTVPPAGIVVKSGRWHVAIIAIDHLSDEEAVAFAIADNRTAELATNDAEQLLALLGITETAGLLKYTGYSETDLTDLLGECGPGESASTSPATGFLSEQFGAPPFTILDARSGWWQERKNRWLSLGIRSELGRDQDVGPHRLRPNAYVGGSGRPLPQTSIFDAVLAELLIRWFSPPGETVLDPFAGGSVRGIVSGLLGRQYLGIDLRAEQIEANEEQVREIGAEGIGYIVGDSREVLGGIDRKAGFILTCPPYVDLEVYSDDPRDLSTMAIDDFLVAYREIIAGAAARLEENRFAAIVVAEVRDKAGRMRAFVRETINAFEDAGLAFYNDAVLVTMAGSAPLRARRQFEAGRKLVKTHQNVLVFVKGDPVKATEAVGEVQFGEFEEAIE